MKYIVDITGPNGNGWYEPLIRYDEDDFWELRSIIHHLEERNTVPAYLLGSLLKYLDKKFAGNYSVAVKPYRED